MRCSSRCASSRRPELCNCSSRHFSSALMPWIAWIERRPRRDVVRVGVDLHELQLVGLVAGERIELVDRFDLVAEQVDAPGAVFVVRREDVDDVAAHPEGAAREIRRGALVLRRDQIGDHAALLDLLALLDREGHRRIGLDRADAVDARHRGDDDDVVAFEQRARRRVAHAVDLLVDRGILLDVGVGARDIGFRLVVIVIRDEILHRVVGEEALELAVELRRQGLVRRQDDRRPLRRLDHLRHGEGLARAGDAEQHLGAVVALGALDQVLDRGRLIALRRHVGLQHDLDAAFGLLRTRRPMRRPHRGAAACGELRPAFAQQLVQRLHAGGDAERDRLRRRPVHDALLAARLGDDRNLVALRRFAGAVVDQRLVRIVLAVAQRVGEFRVDVERRAGDIAALRRLVEALGGIFRDRLARRVLVPPVGAALERIVRRRLQPGSRAHSGGALFDAGVEQPLQRRIGRRGIRPMRLGTGRARVITGLFRLVGGLGHRAKYGWSRERREGLW